MYFACTVYCLKFFFFYVLTTDWKGKNSEGSSCCPAYLGILAENPNPSSPELDPENFYFFTNGVVLKADIAEDLLGMCGMCEKWTKEFFVECKKNPGCYEETIKKQLVKDITEDGMKVTIKGKELKIT